MFLATSILRATGDNDWNDCLDPDQGLLFWETTFNNFHEKWNHSLEIYQQPGYPLNFVFQLGETLFLGLQIVGSESVPGNRDIRLADYHNWTSTLIHEYIDDQTKKHRVGRVVVAAHADPWEIHDSFFIPFKNFIANEIQNQIPILYLNGDGHSWKYEPNFLGQPSLLRITIEAKARHPPVKVQINDSGDNVPTGEAFLFDRQFPKCKYKEKFKHYEGMRIQKYVYSKFLDKTVCQNACIPVEEFFKNPEVYWGLLGKCT